MLRSLVFLLMLRRPPISTRTDTLFPYTALFRSCTRCSVAIPAAARVSNRSLHHPFPQLLFEYAASDAVAAVARGVGFLVVDRSVNNHCRSDRKSTRLNSSH